MLNVLNGGAHADNSVDIQEFMLVPLGFERFSQALRAGVEVYHQLKSVLKEKGLTTAVGDEGGFAPNLGSNREALDLLMRAIEGAGYRPGEQIALAVDVAASELVDSAADDARYDLPGEGRRGLEAGDLIDLYEQWIEAYPLVSIEDGLAEDDHPGWKDMTSGWVDRYRSSETICSLPIRRFWRRNQGRTRQRPARQGQPDRKSVRDVGRCRVGKDQRLRQCHEPPVG